MREKDAARWFERRRQLNLSGSTRRDVARAGLLISGGLMVGLDGRPLRAQTQAPFWAPSPTLTPFVDPLPIPRPLPPKSLSPPPTPSAHQFYDLFPAQKTYEITLKEGSHRWHRDLPTDKVWGYEGYYPGPLLDFRYGEPVVLRVRNELPALNKPAPGGFGLPSVSMHLHNFHTASESDGGPWNWTDPGDYKDHHYAMARAGFTSPDTTPSEFRDWMGGDVRESLTTLFFHDHRPEFTAANVYKGMMGGARVFDEQDTGNEEDLSPRAWRLPSGDHDIPLILADKRFDENGELFFDPFFTEGFLGDRWTVNGKVQPFLEVKRRKYRFRIYNPGPSRGYRLSLRRGTTGFPMTQVSQSGNLLNSPVSVNSFDIWPAERFDVVIDFRNHFSGQRLYLVNTAQMAPDGRGIQRYDLSPNDPANRIIEFRVTGNTVSDPSRVPTYFRPYPAVDTTPVTETRDWVLGRSNGLWSINGRLWDPEQDHLPQNIGKINRVKRNSSEIWRFHSVNNGWDHPMHVHLEEGQILKSNGIPVQVNYRTDMYRLGRNGSSVLEVLMRFRDFPDPGFTPQLAGTAGRYVMHCHNTIHEDHAMMATFNVEP